ncbi:B-type lectin plumieribetin-like [Trichomycterus rosablanca]|uniref:B-type lectin plumieribetin-like n=1 Tax=Trichomycterus rosablanca TaxID=2290929 RepID=UPI002F35ED7E
MSSDCLKMNGVLKTGEKLVSLNKEYQATLQTDGDFVLILTNTGAKKWVTNTSNEGGQHLEMQHNGNLVLYDSKNKCVWSTNSTCPAPVDCYLKLSDDGYLKIYNNEKEVWRSS